MSFDNPGSTDETDKLAPRPPAPAETRDGEDAYDPDLDALAEEALSQPPINYDEDPVLASGPGSAGYYGGGYGPAGWDQGAAGEAGGSLEQAGYGAGAGTLDDSAEVYDPDLDALAEEALSQPPIDYGEDLVPVRPPAAPDYGFDDDPAPASGSQDGAAGSASREPESEAEPAARERPVDEAAEQSAASAPGREHAEADAETTTSEPAGKQGRQDETSEQVAREVPPVRQQDYSDAGQNAPVADPPPDVTGPGLTVPEAAEPTAAAVLPAETDSAIEAGGGQDNADTVPIVAPGDDIPATPAVSSDGELSAEQESQPAERPEDPAASLTTIEVGTREPGTAEAGPDETAQPEDPLPAITAEPGTGGGTGSGETVVVPEAESAQVSTAEHDPQTQDPAPAGERSPAGGATSETNSGSEDGGGSGPKPPDGPGPGGDTGKGHGPKDLVLHWKGNFHGEPMEMYSGMKGKDFMSGTAMNAAIAQAKGERERGKSRIGPAHGITDFPHDRDLGGNAVGENLDVRLGDTTDPRTFGEKMAGEGGAFGEAMKQEADEGDDSARKKAGRLLDAMMEHGDDFHDAVGTETETANQFFLRGTGPTNADLPQHPDGPAYVPVPSQGLNVGDAVGGTVLLTAAALTGIRHLINSRREEHEHG